MTRGTIALAAALVCAAAMTSLSMTPAWADAAPLTQLEDHFFQHTYPADTEEDRLARLEKLVFGEAKTGDASARVSDLQKVVAEADSTPSSGSSSSSSGSGSGIGSAGTNGPSSSSPNTSSSSSSSSSDASAGNSTDSAALAGTDYPRVDELEQLILNQSFKQLPLAKRLNQLETKAFGKPSTDDDLSARTDALEIHWEKTLSPSLERQYLSTVEWLENKVIGQSYSSKPLIERVQTLEGIVFANQPPDTTTGIKEQLETLTNAVHISKNSTPNVTPMAGADQSQQSSHSYPGQPAQSQYTSQGQYPQSPPPYPTNQGLSQSYGSQGYGQPYTPPAYGQQSFQMPSAENLQGGQGQNYQASQNYQQNQGYQQGSGYQQNQGYQPAQSYQQPQGYQPAQNYQTAQSYQQPQGYQSGQATENSVGTSNNAGMNSSANEQQAAQAKGHPLLKGLAKALGTAATMAAGAMSSGMMNMNFGNNGMYGNSLYSGGGYNGYNTGYGGYNGYTSGIHF